MVKRVVKVGTRKSQLAMIQTTWVVEELKKLHKDIDFEIVQMSTIGDKILDKSLSKTGEKSLFTKELEDALLAKKVDLVVNSLKDMPSSLPHNLTISAVSKREDPRDAVVMHPKHFGKRLEDLCDGSVIGTSSLRRVAQLQKILPNLHFRSIRGNLNTRLRKLDNGDDFAAIILAVAGIKRMGWAERISYILTTEECLYAIGQGALGIETRADDADSVKLVSELHDRDTVIRTVAERAFLKTLGGGCSVPQAVHTWIINSQLYIKAGVYNLDGSKSLVETMQAELTCQDAKSVITPADPDTCCEFASITTSHKLLDAMLLKIAGHLGRDLGILLLKKGAKEILEEARMQNMAKEDNV